MQNWGWWPLIRSRRYAFPRKWSWTTCGETENFSQTPPQNVYLCSFLYIYAKNYPKIPGLDFFECINIQNPIFTEISRNSADNLNSSSPKTAIKITENAAMRQQQDGESWKLGRIETDSSVHSDAVVVKCGQKYYILPKKNFWPGLQQLKKGWEIYFQAENLEINQVFMYGPAGIPWKIIDIVWKIV